MTLSLFNLENKVAIVTGATSGLGEAIAIGLAEAGADVAGVGSSGRFAGVRPGVERQGRETR